RCRRASREMLCQAERVLVLDQLRLRRRILVLVRERRKLRRRLLLRFGRRRVDPRGLVGFGGLDDRLHRSLHVPRRQLDGGYLYGIGRLLEDGLALFRLEQRQVRRRLLRPEQWEVARPLLRDRRRLRWQLDHRLLDHVLDHRLFGGRRRRRRLRTGEREAQCVQIDAQIAGEGIGRGRGRRRGRTWRRRLVDVERRQRRRLLVIIIAEERQIEAGVRHRRRRIDLAEVERRRLETLDLSAADIDVVEHGLARRLEAGHLERLDDVTRQRARLEARNRRVRRRRRLDARRFRFDLDEAGSVARGLRRPWWRSRPGALDRCVRIDREDFLSDRFGALRFTGSESHRVSTTQLLERFVRAAVCLQ